MKKTILSLALLLFIGGTAPICAQRHRHTPCATTTAVASPSSANGTSSAASATPSATSDDELVAYSDTTATDTADAAESAMDVDDNSASVNNPLLSLGFDFDADNAIGKFTSLTIIIFLFLFLVAPFIVLFAILRYIVRRHNDRVRLAEKAMESGYNLSDEQIPLSRKSPEYIWRRGVRNVSIGAGVMLFLWFLGATPLVGIGGLVACIGLGQMFMARFNYDSRFFGKKRGTSKDDIFDDLNADISDLQFGDEAKEKKKE